MSVQKYIIPHEGIVNKDDRQKIKNHRSGVIWFTGLSGSGKSTLSHALEAELVSRGVHAYVLDGDNVRRRINKDLGFSEKDRVENIRRIGELCALFVDSGIIALSAFISPYQADRKMVREMLEPGEFIEVYVKASLEVCEGRDVKGLYKKARTGEISNFTGITDPYEEPTDAEIVIETANHSVEWSVNHILEYLDKHNFIKLKETV